MSDDRLRPLWVDGDVDATDRNLRGALAAETTNRGRAEVLSQLARLEWVRGLESAGALLDEASELAGDDPVARARVLLERGRVLRRTAGDAAAVPVLEEAYAAALEAEQHFIAADAAHACALAGDMLAWTKRGLELANRYPGASYWRGTLLTNLGDWHRERGEYERSLEAYEAALAADERRTSNPDVMQEASRQLERYLVDRGALEPNLADPVVHLAARFGSLGRYHRYREVVAEARTPQERRRFLLALASFRNLDAIRETLAATLGPDVPTQDVAFILMRMLTNPAGQRDAWTFLKRKWTALRKRMPPLMCARLVEATPALRDARYAREVRAFFKAHPMPEAARALRQAVEVFRLNAELRTRATPGLQRWLAAPR